MNEEKIEKLSQVNKRAELGGGEERIKAQHSKGKLTARERITLLLDPGTFLELDKLVSTRSYDFDLNKKKLHGDGVVTGYGSINEKQIFLYQKIKQIYQKEFLLFVKKEMASVHHGL